MARMFRKTFLFSAISGLAVIVIGCANNKKIPSTDTVVQTDNGKKDVTITDKGPADTGNPDACQCSEKNACCNGCRAINEGNDCEDSNLCHTKGICQSGVCRGGGAPKVCDAPGECRKGTGTCDPDTGDCEYDAAPNGQTCKAKPGIDGSGICQHGKCYGFDACDHSVYDQAANYPCNFDSECANGRCMALDDGWTKYCTQECGPGMDPCPKDMFCVNGGKTAGRFCRPLNREATAPKDGSQGLYAPCNNDLDCKGGLCLALDKKNFCTANCESADHKADDKLCGDCGTCRDNGDKLNFKFKFYCSPRGKRKSGEPCRWSGDCMHRYCLDGLCSEQCLDFNGKSNCPDNMKCIKGVLAADPTILVCVPKDKVDKGFGDECTADYACKNGQKCIEAAGKRVCTTDCSKADATCAKGECTEYASKKKACLPKEWLGTQAVGEPCKAGFQCAEGLQCASGACLKGCKTDDDCAGETCFVDLWKQAAYCVTTCNTEKDCATGMTCFEGQCVLNSDAGVYINGLCRTDEDCVTGLCKGRVCTDTCKEDSDCEGSTAIQAGRLSLCKPCDPKKFGMDCKDDYVFNECVQGMQGNYFCAPQCNLNGNGICPVGTRCYSLNASSVCAPISGSCTMYTACTGNGTCSKPAAPSMPCTETADCGNGECKNGRCDGPDCTIDKDCGCRMKTCNSGRCELAADAGLTEQEPNNTPATAQALDAKTQAIIASLYSQDSPDKDYFKVSLKAGDHLDAWTSPFCKQYADTKLRLLDANGAPIKGWVSDSLAQNYTFSLLYGFEATTDRDIIIEVSQGDHTLGVERVNYVLGVNIFKPVQNDTCGQAIPIATDGQPHHYDLAKATNTMSAKSCTGTSAPGKDMAFTVSVPANSFITIDAETPFDSQLYLITDCTDPNKNCVAGVDNFWKPAPEHLLYANHASSAQDLVLVVDSFLPMIDMGFDLSIKVQSITPSTNDTIATALPINSAQGTITGDTIGAVNDYEAGKDTCAKAALPGRDVVYSMELKPNDTFALTLKDFMGTYPVFWLTTDPTDPQGCLAVTQGSLTYKNEGTVQKAFLVIDSVVKDGYSMFTMDYKISPTSRSFYTHKHQFSTQISKFRTQKGSRFPTLNQGYWQ